MRIKLTKLAKFWKKYLKIIAVNSWPYVNIESWLRTQVKKKKSGNQVCINPENSNEMQPRDFSMFNLANLWLIRPVVFIIRDNGVNSSRHYFFQNRLDITWIYFLHSPFFFLSAITFLVAISVLFLSLPPAQCSLRGICP